MFKKKLCENKGCTRQHKNPKYCGSICYRQHKKSELFARIAEGDTTCGKKRYIEYLLNAYGHRCRKCGLTDWYGEPVALELHHINGDGRDNRLENIEMLCLLCHAQTPTWRGRNVGNPLRKRKLIRHKVAAPQTIKITLPTTAF